jgi:hypothetical protein
VGIEVRPGQMLMGSFYIIPGLSAPLLSVTSLTKAGHTLQLTPEGGFLSLAGGGRPLPVRERAGVLTLRARLSDGAGSELCGATRAAYKRPAQLAPLGSSPSELSEPLGLGARADEGPNWMDLPKASFTKRPKGHRLCRDPCDPRRP